MKLVSCDNKLLRCYEKCAVPKQTNEFQQLVALIHRALAPEGAKVTESAMVAGLDSSEREIDVLVESVSGPIHIKVAVEAKDEGRKMDITRFESLVAKYSKTSGLDVAKVIVVNRAGFTKNVKKRAAVEGIILQTIDEAMAADWALHSRGIQFSIAPHLARIEFDPEVNPTELHQLTQSPVVCTCCGKGHGTPIQWAQKFSATPEIAYDVRVAASRANANACVCATWNLPERFVIRTPRGDKRINAIKAHVHCTQARGTLAVKALTDGDHTVHHFMGDVAGKRIEFVVPDGPHSEQISLRVSTSDKSSIPGGPPNAAVDPSDLRPSQHQSDSQVVRLLRSIETEFSGLDVAAAPGLAHNFARGTDHPVDLLVHIYLNWRAHLTSAIVFCNEGEDEDALKQRWMVLAEQCSLDRVLIFSRRLDVELPDLADVKLRVFVVSLADFEKQIARMLVPLVWVSTHSVSELELQLLGPEKRRPGLVLREPQLQIRGILRAPAVLMDTVGGVIAAEVIGNAKRSGLTGETFREVPCSFKFRLPRESYFVHQECRLLVGCVEGTGLIRVLLMPLNLATIERQDKPRIRFASSVGSYSVLGGMLPRSVSEIGVDGPDGGRAVKFPLVRIPEKAFNRALGITNEIELSARGSSPNRVANVRLDKAMAWQLGFHPNWPTQF